MYIFLIVQASKKQQKLVWSVKNASGKRGKTLKSRGGPGTSRRAAAIALPPPPLFPLQPPAHILSFFFFYLFFFPFSTQVSNVATRCVDTTRRFQFTSIQRSTKSCFNLIFDPIISFLFFFSWEKEKKNNIFLDQTFTDK